MKTQNLFVKFFKWSLSAFQENNGKTSYKRVIAFFLVLLAIYIPVYVVTQTSKDVAEIDWTSTGMFEGILFAQITALITAGVIEKKHILNSPSDPSKV